MVKGKGELDFHKSNGVYTLNCIMKMIIFLPVVICFVNLACFTHCHHWDRLRDLVDHWVYGWIDSECDSVFDK